MGAATGFAHRSVPWGPFARLLMPQQIATQCNFPFFHGDLWENVICHFPTALRGRNKTLTSRLAELDSHWPCLHFRAGPSTADFCSRDAAPAQILNLSSDNTKWLIIISERRPLLPDNPSLTDASEVRLVHAFKIFLLKGCTSSKCQ